MHFTHTGQRSASKLSTIALLEFLAMPAGQFYISCHDCWCAKPNYIACNPSRAYINLLVGKMGKIKSVLRSSRKLNFS